MLKSGTAARGGVLHQGRSVCSKSGHRKATCFVLQRRINRAWRMNQCFLESKRYGRVWIAKTHLYVNCITQKDGVTEETCNLVRMEEQKPENVSLVAYISTEFQKWASLVFQ